MATHKEQVENLDRLTMPDRDPAENPGLDLTTPVDNVPAHLRPADEPTESAPAE